jgi:hypothetical protein
MNSTYEVWENRYKTNGNSGNGSYGLLADFKAKIINLFIENNNINSIIELGSGDGNQCSLFNVKNYLGLDISPTIIEHCKNIFKNQKNYEFKIYNKYYINNKKFDLSLSLDVIYHILEDNEYKKYMFDLFNFSNQFVIIYSNNYTGHKSGHMYTKEFTNDIDKWFPEWQLKQIIKQKYPESSSADFYIFEKNTL